MTKPQKVWSFSVKPPNQDVTVRQMKAFLSSNYLEENSGVTDFVTIINRIEELSKRLISYQIDGDKQEWESKLHQFKMEITFEAYKRFHTSRETRRVEMMIQDLLKRKRK
ncbi:hypothetical protein [Halalkalibacter alkalisediminis]|uniref:Uncharacterized protein n=1 Tax=Halalkalibacter alkalisediminis TaxID=935616 RepID=A0ABV6NDD5_9BACI|nr:hypothetical protein [Halalkalibacter alkalisediminis]